MAQFLHTLARFANQSAVRLVRSMKHKANLAVAAIN